MKVNYPINIKSNEEKYIYLYRLQELLKLEHNAKGKEFRESKITEIQWKAYKKNKFDPKSLLISMEIGKYREKLKKSTSSGARLTDIGV